MRRSAVALLLLVLPGLAVAAPLVQARAAGPGTCPVAGQIAPRGDGWTSVRPGTLPSVSVAAVSPADSARLWATDGQDLQRSTDGGCRWSSVAALGDGGPSSASTAPGAAGGITQVLVAGAAGREVVWTSQDDEVTPAGTRSQIRVSTDGGVTFHASAGLPAFGQLRLGVADARTAYAVAAPAALPAPPLAVAGLPPGTSVWVSTDSGTTFTQRATLPGAGLRGVVADPGSPGTAYAWSDHQLWVSTDTGSSFRPVALRDGRGVEAPRITAVDTGPAGLAVFLAGGWVAQSQDAGRHLSVTAAPDEVDSVAHLPGRAMAMVVATRAGNAVFVPGHPTWDVTPVPGGAQDLRASRDGGGAVVLGRTGSSLFLRPFAETDLRALAVVGLPPAGASAPVRAGALLPAGPPSLLPSLARLALQPGAVRRLTYRLTLPPTAGPLDVYFLVDTTPSMREALAGLRAGVQGIVDELAHSQMDVQFGVGDFRDLDDLTSASADRHVYRRDRPVGPAGPALSDALAALQIAAGGRDIPEAQTIALTQAATGIGMAGVVPAGQQAGFRPAATKVIVLITDSPFHQEPPYPSMAQTVGELRSRGIKVVSLAVNNNFAATDPRPDERAVALGTATLAPVEGIDCQGAGVIDVPPGAPAVCVVDTSSGGSLNLRPPIVALLRGVQDPGTVDVVLSGAGLLRTLGATSEITNLAQPVPLAFAVDLTCRPSQAGSVLALALTGRVDGRPVVRASAAVQCLPTAAVIGAAVLIPPRPVLRQPAAGLPPVPAPVPPAAPVTQPQPGAQANPNPNVNPNVAAGTVQQQQQQAELVLAQQDVHEAPGEQMAMVSRPRRQESAALGALSISLFGASAAGAVVLRARTQSLAATARTVAASG